MSYVQDLTTTLLNKNYQRDIQNVSHQTQTYDFNSGVDKVVRNKSMMGIRQSINYTDLSLSEFETLKSTFEDNYFKPFRLDTSDDIRGDLLTNNVMNVYMFESFDFEISANQSFYKGEIVVNSSVLFNTERYLKLHNTKTNLGYNVSTTTNQEFNNILSELNPRSVKYTYEIGDERATVGQSNSLYKQKFLKKVFKLTFICEEDYLIKLRNFYYKKGNRLGTFGLYEDGFINIKNVDPINIKVRFNSDSFDFSRNVNGIYIFNLDFIEVK